MSGIHPDPGHDDSATVPDLIRARAQRSPDAVAVESAGQLLTYRQLTAEADAVAARLRAIGVGPGDLVAVAVPRGADLITALLGVQFSGAAYIPLDPAHPADRLAYIVADSAASVLLAPDAAGSPELSDIARIHLNDIDVRRDTGGVAALRPDSAAYVVYTSGSTGRPKGVLVTHRAFANFVRSMRDRPGLPDGLVLPAVTTVSFDIAGLELFGPLVAGGRVVVADQAEIRDPQRLAGLLAGTGARTMQATPITWRLLLETGWTPPPGFTVLCGGERLPAELADRLLGEEVVLWDLYGPTETTVWSSATRYQRGVPPEFRAVRDTTLHLLDESLRPVPAGENGELYIGGAGLAAGYLHRPGRTAARFVADPYGRPGARLYHTGDIARRHGDGRIEILGRSDDQIKIHGFRIEPGEIEYVLEQHPEVAEAAVLAVDDGGTAALVGYVRPADPAAPPETGRLHRHLARSLPAHMVPARYVVLGEFPRTPNRKLDRAALPAGAGTPGETAAATGSATEQLITAIVAEVLRQPTIGAHDDFFALGGDSLRAVQIVLRLNEELRTEVPINALFETRTVAGLAAVLDGDAGPEPRALADGRAARLSAAQWRLWLYQSSQPHSVVDNAVIVVRLPGPLDPAALEKALTGLFERHAVLRTRYPADPVGLPNPVSAQADSIPVREVDGDPRAILGAAAARPFDLATELPLRLYTLCHTDATVLLVVVHRIAADDRSLALIAHEVRTAYRGRSVPAPPLSYGDYAEWQRDYATGPAAQQHLDFWRGTLAGLRPAELVSDRPRPEIRDRRCGTVHFDVPAGVTRALTADRDATLFTVLLTGLFTLLAQAATGSDLAVGIPAAGRGRAEWESLVGMFEETAVIRVRVGERPGFTELLGKVEAAVRGAVEHAVLPFEDVVAASDAITEPGRHPLFDVFFALEPIPADRADFGLPDAPETRFDLACRLTERPDGGVDGRFEYATQLFDATTVVALAGDYTALLATAAAVPESGEVSRAPR
ncbi:non-ribosomal peptide synthetase [Nocardia sp. alder85J]|uniref:non-ribosomal peptide synthetase n=1 Tax=Nocardia sp. alder85J TaxID=2862949 RepID=UPI001CD3C791|nr:non-ribosomal peptide synthetase [Nocardia sp. alder85J]MCX4091646.1 non-ribosomal peptide synthetase [Nocardia sp. alder85J]